MEDNDKLNSSKKYIQQIINSKTIAIMGHSNPDADAICSAIALKRLIKQNLETETKKYIVDLFFDVDEIDEQYKPLVGNQEYNKQNVLKYDLAISVDSASRQMLGIYDKIFRRSKDTLNIDHHETNQKFAKNNIVSSKCSSTCELLYFLFIRAEKWNYTPDIYSLIYAGIITDTNNLSQNIGINTFAIVSEIMQKSLIDGTALEKIRDYFFKSKTPEQLSLLTRALESLNFYCNGEIATMKINKQDFSETDTDQDDTLGIVDYAMKLQNVKIGILFIKQENNTYYVSLRSKESIDVGQIAKLMGGGGHQNIAAFQTTEDQSLTEVKTELFDLCKKQLSNQEIDNTIENLFVEVVGNGPIDEEQDVDETTTD